MGRPKIKIIDDSKPEEEEKKKTSKKSRDKTAKSDVVEATFPVIASEAKQSSQEENQTQIATSSLDELETPRNDKNEVKKTQKPGKTKKVRSKKYQELIKDLDKSKTYPLSEAVDMAKKLSYAKFNATLEAHINTVALGIRGLVSLPYASGKKLRILAFGKGAEDSGASFFGTDEIIEEINKGKVSFDLLVTTPEWMPKLAKVAKVLGPRGLMPNPKNGTITNDLKKVVESFQSGKTEYKTESKAPVIHLGLGKLDQPTEELSANIKTLLQTIGKTRVKKVSLSPTMGPSVKVDLNTL